MTRDPRDLSDGIDRAVRAVRALALAALLGAVLASAAVVLLAAWAVGDAWRAGGPGPAVLLAGGIAAASAAVVLLAHHWVRPVTQDRVAAELERRLGVAEGAVRAILELGRGIPVGTSRALFQRSEAELERRLAGVARGDMAGDLGARTRGLLGRVLAVAAGLVVLVAAAGFGAPERARAGWAPLLSPMDHLRGPALPPLTVWPGDAEVDRGAAAELRIRAPLRDRVRLHWRAVGEVPASRAVGLRDGVGSAVLGPVGSPIRYWVAAADGAVSDTFTLSPIDPLLLRGLSVAVDYPAHVGRPDERYDGDLPPLVVPEGTRLRIRGSATRPLAGAALVGPREGSRGPGAGGPPRLEVAGDGFTGEWVLGRGSAGRYGWRLDGADGRTAELPGPDVRVIADEAPRVRITSPEPEVAIPADRRQVVRADAEDDHGIRAAALVFRRAGEGGAGHRITLPVAADAARLFLEAVLDAADVLLLPGDALEYHVEVTDNSPRARTGRSATQVLRVPGSAELRERARAAAAQAQEDTERLAERGRRLEREARNLGRRAAAGSRGGGAPGAGKAASPEDRLGFEGAREAEHVMREHESLVRDAAALAEQLEQLQRLMREAGLQDADLQRRMAELRELERRLEDPEVEAELARMREAVDALDPEAVRQALEELAARQEELREALEDNLERLRRAAAEQELASLAREAEEIAARQRALAEAMEEDDRGAADVERPAPGDASDEPMTPREPAAGSPPPLPLPGSAGQTAAGGTGEREGAEQEATERPGGEQPPGEQPGGDQPGADQRGGEQDGGERGRQGEQAGGNEGGGRQGGTEPDSAGAEPPQDGEDGLPGLPSLPKPSLPTLRSQQQDSLWDRAENLNAAIRSLRPELLQMGERDAASQAGSAQEKGKSAQQAMQAASAEAKEENGAGAAASGRKAASEMAAAASTLESARRDMVEGRKREARRAIRQATQEALDIAQAEEQVRETMERADREGIDPEALRRLQSEQAALQEGLRQLGRNLSEAGRHSGLVDAEVGQALARALLRMQQTLGAMGQGGGGLPLEQAEASVDALNRLAMALLENDARMDGASGGSLEEALEQLADLAREQASVNARAAALAPLETGSSPRARELAVLARQQQGIGRRVGEVSQALGGRDDVLGQLDLLASEADAVARELEGGRLDSAVRARQERLFHRLLDAGRTMEREEYSEEREGTTARARAAESPEALDRRLLERGLRYVPPGPERLKALPPAYRRLVLEYFQRLNEGARP